MEVSLRSHRSVRNYRPDRIPDEWLDDILDAGIRASNTGNMQLYSVVVTQDPEMKGRLSPLHFNQPMVNEAPVLLTVCVDFNRFQLWCKLNHTSAGFLNLLWLLNGTIDASIVAQNMCVAAESYGLGICYLGTALYHAPEISEVLGLPVGVIPVTAVTIGFPQVVPGLTDRLPARATVHYERYTGYTDSEIRELYREKEEMESSVKFISENGKENLAQVYAEVRYKAADSAFFSEKLMNWLKGQGFNFGVQSFDAG
jgi:nitroreductase